MLSRSLFSGVPFLALVMTSVMSMGCELFDMKTTLAGLGPTLARVEVDLDAEPMVHLMLPASDGACEAITNDVKASVNDRQMDLFKRGGEEPSQGAWVCGPPTFRRALGADDLTTNPTVFRVEDRTAKIHIEVDGLLAERTIAIDTPDGFFTAGTETHVSWSAELDELDAADMDVEIVYEDPALVLPAPASFRLDAGSIFVKVAPSSPPGKATLRINATVGTPVVVCEGAKSCEAKVMLKTELPLDIVAPGTTP